MNTDSKRKNATELPEVKELELIIEREAKRPVAPGKENAHFAKFELAIRWLEFIGLPTDIFTKNFTWQKLVVLGTEIQPKVVSETLQKKINGKDKDLENLMKDVTKYLGEEDIPQKSDIIFVFGSKSLLRIEAAVDLYKKGLAPKIFITGGMPIYEKNEKPEAVIFRDWAVEHGVSSQDIFIHDTAISVADNIRGGLNALDSLGLEYSSIILVTTWFAMRRSWAMTMKYVSQGTKLYRVNASVASTGNVTPEGWWKNETGIKTVFNEFGKLKISEVLNSS